MSIINTYKQEKLLTKEISESINKLEGLSNIKRIKFVSEIIQPKLITLSNYNPQLAYINAKEINNLIGQQVNNFDVIKQGLSVLGDKLYEREELVIEPIILSSYDSMYDLLQEYKRISDKTITKDLLITLSKGEKTLSNLRELNKGLSVQILKQLYRVYKKDYYYTVLDKCAFQISLIEFYAQIKTERFWKSLIFEEDYKTFKELYIGLNKRKLTVLWLLSLTNLNVSVSNNLLIQDKKDNIKLINYEFNKEIYEHIHLNLEIMLSLLKEWSICNEVISNESYKAMLNNFILTDLAIVEQRFTALEKWLFKYIEQQKSNKEDKEEDK